MCQCRYAILPIVILWICLATSGDIIRDVDICGPHNGRRLYVELGEQGVLRADNVSLVKNAALRQDASRPYVTNSSHDQCSLELVTCPSCVISLTFKSINLLHHCGDGGMTIDSPCRCDYVWISEPPYEDVSGTPFCGHYAPISYRTSTRTLSIALLYSQSHEHAFELEYTAERNRLILKGSSATGEMSKSMNNTGSGGGILTSPFFPARYPRDLGMEYIVTCPTDSPSCRVRVLFSDFQLAAVSIMEFYDWNGQRLDVSSGARFRPPIIVSSGPTLLIRFYANGGTGLGYKAFYSFVAGQTYDRHNHPITDCGGYVDNLGGTITMMDMVVGEGVKTYDCVWLISSPKNILHMQTHMYLKVINFAEMAGNTELIIKQGPTSAQMPLEILRHPVSQLQPPKLREHVAPITSGFHVSLRGSFGPSSRLAIAYAAFSYTDCFTGSEFLCQNHRCISSQLNCDGFDHCGDNSDEPATCLRDWDISMPDRKWQQNKANYYFPKIDRYPDLKTATLVFVGSSLGLIVMISALIILLYRVGARARHQRELQSRLRTISELLDGARIDEISVTTDEPPVYEAPPNYDEVIKLGMEEESNGASTRRKKRRTDTNGTTSSRDSRRSRSNPSSHCSCEYEVPQQLTLDIREDASRSSQTSPIPPNTGEPGQLPESPPPPYVTPPDTVPRNFDHAQANDRPGPSGRASNAPTTSRTESSDSGSSVCRGNCKRNWYNNSSSLSRSLPSSPPSERRNLIFHQTQNQNHSSSSQHQEAGSFSPVSADISDSALGAYQAGPAPAICHRHQNQHLNQHRHPVPAPTQTPQPPPPLVPTRAAHHRRLNDAASRLPQSTRSSAVSTSTRAECVASCASADAPTGPVVPPQRVAVGAPPRRTAAVAARGEDEAAEGAEGDDPEDERVSTICSTPCGTFGESCRGRIRAAPISDRERLRDEFDVVSETTSSLEPGTLANTPCKFSSLPVVVDSSVPRPRDDLDNLYESIKILDSFLARRSNVVNNHDNNSINSGNGVNSMTVMLFGTPRHRHRNYGSYASTSSRRGSDNDESTARRIRVWKSEDAFNDK